MANLPSSVKNSTHLISLTGLSDTTRRFERKFFIENEHTLSVEALVKSHPAIFREVFYRRQVNNIYLDTHDLKNFWDNVAGSQHRAKVRIRWYGELFGEISSPTLEIKVKDGFVGWKVSYPLPAVKIEPSTGSFELTRTLECADLPHSLLVTLKTLKPTLINTYWRKYFVSADGAFRLTVDDSLMCLRPGRLSFAFAETYHDRRTVIMEIKYADSVDSVADEIAGEFPYRVTKSSKYVSGLETLGVAEC